jgi:CheY-like chemotaxis protein
MEAIGTLAGGIAHDFNNILQSIRGFAAHGIDQVPEGSEAQSCLREIQAGGLRAAELVDHIMTFSRQRKRELGPVSLGSLVTDVLGLLQGSLPSTIQIRQRIAKNCPMVLADATELHQVVMNLCTNAYHAIGDRNGVLDVRVESIAMDAVHVKPYPELEPGEFVRIIVKDDGSGMDEETLACIFDPFFTTKDVGKGTGLGLSAAHGIIHGHGGVIYAISSLGEGTEFIILLPVSGAGEDVVAPAAPVAGMSPPQSNARVMLVDDEEAIVKVTTLLLEKNGYRVRAHECSAEALNAFREDPHWVDVVVTDYTMPNMTGMELIRELRSLREGIPVVLCTGDVDRIREQENKSDLKSVVVLKKPVKFNDLSRSIEEAVNVLQC